VKIHILDPLLDSRWGELAAHHPNASVFHDPGWLKALALTYGYEPFALTSAPPGEPLTNGLVACRVSSWMTGTRLVSLPFSDHCEPLVDRQEEAEEFARWMKEDCDLWDWKYIELRPLSMVYGNNFGLQPSGSYWFHELDLGPGLDQTYERLHKNSFQRKIERAGREGISYEAGRSEQLLREFYRLLVNTRKRQQLLPQPRIWFQNLVDFLGKKLEIRVARKAGAAIAAILTLRHRTTVVYKYGCSDEQFHNLGAMPFLFWKLVEESKAAGAAKIDFGRTDLDNPGLLAFKDRLGTSRRQMTYYRYTKDSRRTPASLSNSRMVRQFFSILPDAVSAAAGKIIYRHFG
jgi:CelD/BcsL family acetyltransferase involved in cellulose biosynthesis